MTIYTVSFMTRDVFISYASEDESAADAARAALEAQGIRCWIAPRDVSPSEDETEAMLTAIDASSVVVLCLSSAANASKLVTQQAARAFNKNITIVPLKIGNVEPSDALKLFLGSQEAVDAYAPPLQSHLAVLVAVVSSLLAKTTAPAVGVPTSREPLYEEITPAAREPRSSAPPLAGEAKFRIADENESSMGVRILEIVAGISILMLSGYVIVSVQAQPTTLSALLAIALIILGVVCVIRIFAKDISEWRRLLNLILSALAIMIAIYVIADPYYYYNSSKLLLLLPLALMFVGVASAARGTAGGVIVGILGIIIGFFVIISPDVGLGSVAFLLAIALMIFGLESIVSGLVGRRV